MGAAPTRRAHKETQTPSPCESTLAVEFGLHHILLDYQNFVLSSLKVREIGRKSFALSILLYAPMRRAHKETQTPSPCESTLAVEYGVYDKLHHRPLEQTSRAGLHKP